MGSWAELDAVYPPGALSPAAALVACLGRLEGAQSVYREGPPVGRLAAWLPRGLGYDPDLLARAEHYLAQVPLDQLLEQARALLTPRQRFAVALNVLDRQLATPDDRARADRAAQIIAGLAPDTGELAAHRRTLALKNDLSVFPQ
jgi:hypothetical protein